MSIMTIGKPVTVLPLYVGEILMGFITPEELHRGLWLDRNVAFEDEEEAQIDEARKQLEE